jgi:hypothetical protein
MWEAAPWQVIWDWGSKIGLGGVAVWLVQRWISQRDKAAERGRSLVDDASPELVPLGNRGDQYTIELEVRNQGKGVARTLRLGFPGYADYATRVEVPVGAIGRTGGLDVRNSPFFTERDNERAGHAEIALAYADRYGNEYRLVIPVERQRRDDGGFNMDIRRRDYQTVAAKLTKKRLRKIGGS